MTENASIDLIVFSLNCINIVTLTSSRLTLVLSCAMKFEIYPHDTQYCSMMIESCKFLHVNSSCFLKPPCNLVEHTVY